MSFMARWAGPFAGATAVLGAVIGFVVLGEGGPQVPVPAAAVVHVATTSADDDHPESSSSPPFTVVYPKRTVDVVEVPGADEGPDRIDGGGSSPNGPSPSLLPTRSADDGRDQNRPPAGATPTRSETESDDSRDSRDHTTRPSLTPPGSPSETSSPDPTRSNDDSGDGAHTPDS